MVHFCSCIKVVFMKLIWKIHRSLFVGVYLPLRINRLIFLSNPTHDGVREVAGYLDIYLSF